jgi:hypothetical protein
MSRKEQFWAVVVFAVGVPLLSLLCTILFPQKAEPADFGTAFTRATIDVPPGADPASMGNAWVSQTPDYSSYSAATLGANSDFKAGITGNYLASTFGSGLKLQLAAATITAKLPKEYGVLQLTYANARTGQSPTLMDADLKLNSAPLIGIQYGVKVAQNVLHQGDKMYLGLSYDPTVKSEIHLLTADDTIRIKSRGYTLGGSALYQYNDKFNVGAYYSYGHSKVTEDEAAYGGHEESGSNSNQWRIGASYHVTSMTYVSLDIDRTTIDSSGKTKWFAGVEQGIVKDVLYVYGGLADGLNKPTAGIGIYTKHVGINLAYMRHYYKELTEFFGGNGNVYMATFYIRL